MAEKKEAAVDSTRRLAEKVAEKADRIKYLVLIAIAVLIAAALGIGWARSSRAKREAAADNALFKAELDAIGKTPDEVLAIFGNIAAEYAGLPAAEQALVYQFAYQFYTGNIKEAEEPLRAHLKNYPASSLSPQIRLALGQTLLAQGDFDGAKRELEPLHNGPAKVMPEARLAYAQALEGEAELARGEPAEYNRRLELAREAYLDIVGQAQSRVSVWPQLVVQNADFSLLMVNDKLAGYEYRNLLRPPASAVDPAAPSSAGTETAVVGDAPAPDRSEAVEAPAEGEAGAVDATGDVRPPAPAAE
ncbi:MAG: tetratricopeptide repeat protein [Planctomycetota bacterium]|jgi:predicted negative regulator of RcsB-dependent stress response|nr:tetratricopeptide repeat protein [Planctomycetota bacterium]